LYFQVHQPFRLRTYRFFNIGDDHHYFDEYLNKSIIRRVAEKSYMPANKMMLALIREYGDAFKISYSISGTALEQLQHFAPEVIHSFRELASTGCVEFLAETYAHSLASLGSPEEFGHQVDLHVKTIEKLFGQRPVTFRNSELIYSDKIGEMISGMGFNTMMTEGAKHILGWKSPNYMYCSSVNPKLKLLLRNFRLSDDISFRFSSRSWSEWPLTTEKFVGWLNTIDKQEEVVNVFIDYETIGERQWKETGIFDFFRSLPATVFSKSKFTFSPPRELSDTLQPVAAIHVPYAISWADEERDLTSWLGNELQDEAFEKLYSVEEKVRNSKDENLVKDWRKLQTTDHFYYMSTKWFSDGAIHKYYNPYPSPYEAFINYMNVLSDFLLRVERDTNPRSSSPVTRKLKETEAVVSSSVVLKTKKNVTEKEARVKGKKKEKSTETGFKSISFKLDTILQLSDRKVKEMLKNLDAGTLAYGLKGADKAVREKIERNLGKRALKQMNDLSDQLKNIKASEVERSRKLIEKELNLFLK
jgi:alpha-amylase